MEVNLEVKEEDQGTAKIAREIILKRNEILDEFAKAYLAENLKDMDIRDLQLNECFNGNTWKWWFSAK